MAGVGVVIRVLRATAGGGPLGLALAGSVVIVGLFVAASGQDRAQRRDRRGREIGPVVGIRGGWFAAVGCGRG